jgi:ankyrin repeat protein
MAGETVEAAFFADKRFKTDEKLDENKIRRYILTCISGLLSLQEKRGSIGNVESRIFFRTISNIGGVFSSNDRSAADLATDQQDLISGFMIRSYLNVESRKEPGGGDTDWHKEHWVCLFGADSGLQEDELKDVLKDFPIALTKASVALPSCHFAVAATKLYRSLEFFCPETLERYCPRLAHMTAANGDMALHYAARYSRSADALGWILGLNPSAVKATSKDRGETPLHYLVSRRCFFPDQMSMLCQLLHADVSAALVQDSDGNTPLHLLCKLKANKSEVKATLMAMRKQLLDTCPAAASIANLRGRLPLHDFFVGDSDTRFLQQLIAAYPEGLQHGDERWSLPAHQAASVGTLKMLEIVLEAYPDAVSSNVVLFGTPLHCAMRRSDAVSSEIVRYLYDKYPAAIKTGTDGGWYPLHYAASRSSYEVLKFIHTIYPEAISIATTDDYRNLPLHVLMTERNFTSPLTGDADMLRYLLRHYPAAITIPAGPKDKNKNVYELAVRCKLPAFVRRLLLRAAPELDPDELHRLNYAERRMALFLAHCAISNDDHYISNRSSSSNDSGSNGGGGFILQLRALTRRNMGELFRLIVSFL